MFTQAGRAAQQLSCCCCALLDPSFCPGCFLRLPFPDSSTRTGAGGSISQQTGWGFSAEERAHEQAAACARKAGKVDWVDRNNQSTKWPFRSCCYPGNNAALIRSFIPPAGSSALYSSLLDGSARVHRAAQVAPLFHFLSFL